LAENMTDVCEKCFWMTIVSPREFSFVHCQKKRVDVVDIDPFHDYGYIYLLFKYSSIAIADFLPATIAVTTRSGPVTPSPPAKIFSREV